MAKKKKVRLDSLLAELGLVESRTKAQALIMEGKVLVDGVVTDKPGKEVSPDAGITLKEEFPYVGRGGLKLEGFLDSYGLDVTGLKVIDVGASTGGFTDCLLKRGAEHVYAIDVGVGLLDYKLKNDPRVTVLEGRNIRYLGPEEVGEKVGLVVIDVSFISLEKVLPKAKEFLKEGGRVLALIKPQFEVGKGEVEKGGVIRDPEKQKRVIDRIKDFSETTGFKTLSTIESPIRGAKGNREFWIFLAVV